MFPLERQSGCCCIGKQSLCIMCHPQPMYTLRVPSTTHVYTARAKRIVLTELNLAVHVVITEL
jgi:hypothetical protein